MQQVDDPPSLPVGTEVSAKYKGAFCEAKVSKVVRNIKVRVIYKQSGLGSGIVPDDAIKSGALRVGSMVEVKHPDKREVVEATITKIQDCSQYTVVFDDGDITTLRRTALCLKSGRHFNESETLDQLPLTHPEHFGNPVVGGRRGRRSRQLHEDSSDDDDESDAKEVINEKEEHIGKVVCVESTDSKKKDKYKWFPALVVSPTAQATVRIRVKDEYLVRSFKDGRYYTVPKKEATEFTRETAAKVDSPAVQAALEYLDKNILPPHWDRDTLFGLSNSSSEYEGEHESDSSDDEPCEEKDHFVAQLYKYMDDRGTPLNKVPSIQNRDVDLYRLFRTVQKLGGYNRVTSQNQWKSITSRLGFSPITVSVTNLVKQAYKKFLQPYEDFHRKLGCSMLMTPLSSNRSKGRSLVRANSVASPKLDMKEPKPSTSGTSVPGTSQPITAPTTMDESENNSESSNDAFKPRKSKPPSESSEKQEEKPREEKKEFLAIKPAKIKMEVDADSSTGPSVPTLPVSGGTAVKKSSKKSSHDEKRGRKKDHDEKGEKSRDDFAVNVGDKLKVYYHEKKVTYEAKVIEISLVKKDAPLYLVHYTGWNNRYDEWVPRERIAENLSSNVHKKRPTQSDKAPKSLSSVKNTPANKKIRGRSDSLPPRSTTPSSVASNSSRTKSPANSGASQKRSTRLINLSSFNIQSDLSDSDSETDSDEPVGSAKILRRENSVSSSNQPTVSTSRQCSNSATDSGDNDAGTIPSTSSAGMGISTKGRDYDLNQIRSELKGFQELKSPASDAEVDIPTKLPQPAFDFAPREDESEKKDEQSKSSSTELSSETDSFGDDDSQSSDKTTTLVNMTEKFKQKLKAEKLIQVQKDSVPSTLASSGVEKIINDSLAEKRNEILKNIPLFMEKIKTTPVKVPPIVVTPVESPKAVKVEENTADDLPIAALAASLSISKSKNAPEAKTTPVKARKPSQHTEETEPVVPEVKSTLVVKSVFPPESPSKSPQPAAVTPKEHVSDVYEFKEPEPFEFECRKSTPLLGAFSSFHAPDVEKAKRNIWNTPEEKPVFQSKKKKPSSVAEISANVKHLNIDDSSPLPSTSSSAEKPSTDSVFEVLRKSPSANLNINALNEELAATVHETTKALTDVIQMPDPILSPKRVSNRATNKTNLTFVGGPCEDSKYGGIANVFELKQDAETKLAGADISSDIKFELETVKKMILSESSMDGEDKPSSIADKVLKALSQKREEDKIKELKAEESMDVDVDADEEKKVKIEIKAEEDVKVPEELVIATTSTLEASTIQVDSKFFKDIEEMPTDAEHKVDIFDSIPTKNNDLSETIQKLESAIQNVPVVPQYDDESSNSTDSERRLIIEDEFDASVQTDASNSVKNLDSQPDADDESLSVDSEEEEESDIAEPTPPPVIEPEPYVAPKSVFGLQATIFSNASLLSDAGIRPIIQSPVGGSDLLLPIVPPMESERKPEVQDPEISSLTESLIVPKKDESAAFDNPNPHTESISLLLCEETIPGSPTPVMHKESTPEVKGHLHPVESDIKPVPMDIECMAPCSSQLPPVSQQSPSGAPEFLLARQLSEEDKSTPQQDFLSQEESSEDVKKSILDGDFSPKKRRRGRKHSEADSAIKRRRTALQAGAKKGNASDSDDNSDTASQKSSSGQPMSSPFNFLVQLDNSMNPNQRITILQRKITDLKKTYAMVKAELASIDRRRKKLRRRDRERKQQQKSAS